MMTKHLRIILALILLMAVSAAKASTDGYYTIIDGIYYDIDSDDNTASVAGCDDNLTEITIPASITVDGATYRVTKVGNRCFAYCTSLKSVTIPSSVTSLGDWCFRECTSLESVSIPNSVTSWEGGCFEGCTSLKSVNIPVGVTGLDDDTFLDCRSLTSINIPISVKYIEDNCFKNCESLVSITIPRFVKYVDRDCFIGCTNLKDVTCLATTPPYTNEDNPPFDNLGQKTLYVPDVEAYKYSDYEWKDFGKILPLSASGIKAVSKDDIGMNVENGTLTLSNVPENEPVSVYSTTGQLLGAGKGNISVDAQGAQMVIVKVGGKSYKVLAK